MKNKMVILFILLSLSALCSCRSYDENNAKVLVKSKVPKCVNIIKVSYDIKEKTYYAAVDSAYNIHVFSVTSDGKIEDLTDKK